MHPSPVSELGLDDSVALGYTYKCLASAVSSFLSGSSSGFVAAICDLVEEAGDADTNAAVAGALLGCVSDTVRAVN